MACILLEGFDWCASDQLQAGPWLLGNGGLAQFAGYTRNGWSSFISTTLSNAFFGGPLSGWLQWTCGVRWKPALYETNQTIINFSAPLSGTSFNVQQMGFGPLQMVAFSFGETNVSAPSTYMLRLGDWQYFELNVTETCVNVPPSGPVPGYWFVQYEYNLWINDNVAPDMTGIITTPNVNGSMADGNTTFMQFQLSPQNGVIDDVYLSDGERYGEKTIVTLFPNADASVAFTPNGQPDNWQNVNEHNPGFDGDTTYNFSTQAGDIDLYYFQPLPAFTPPSGSDTGIAAVQYMVIARKSDTGSCSFNGVFGVGAADEFASFPVYPGTDYIGQYVALSAPPSGGQWTPSLVSGTPAGIERTS